MQIQKRVFASQASQAISNLESSAYQNNSLIQVNFMLIEITFRLLLLTQFQDICQNFKKAEHQTWSYNLALENQLSQKPKEIQFAVKPSTPANYQLIEQNSISQSEYCWAIAVNEKKTIMMAGCGSKITVFRFDGGKLNQTQVLSDHSSIIDPFVS